MTASLPLINLFPLKSQQPAPSVLARQNALGSPWVQQHYETISDLWQELLDQHDHPGGVAFLNALDACPGYKVCLRATPNLKLVPALNAYRNKKPERWDHSAINLEMAQYGVPLSSGQVLYHGGDLSKGKTIAVGDQFMVPQVLSTSWTPQVAIWHARRVSGGTLFVLTVAPDVSVRAFAFKNRRSESLGHEREVLVESGTSLTCTKVHATSSLSVVECSLNR